ncbi:unnamed protein product [Strongylus vulgaris]|uniref:Uncharacterized protein n=1 Tax=Strongylus vulgaris TaxID=40348 RepID=A0A3P7IV22_STRVU|nr:unnamed protein product [Strongylus vulgaris]
MEQRIEEVQNDKSTEEPILELREEPIIELKTSELPTEANEARTIDSVLANDKQPTGKPVKPVRTAKQGPPIANSQSATISNGTSTAKRLEKQVKRTTFTA